MRHLVLGLLAVGAALGPIAAAPAMAGNGALGAASHKYEREHGRDHGRDHGDRGGDRQSRWNNNDGGDRREARHDRHDDNRWSNRGHDWKAAGWDRKEDRWDRRENRWDRRDDRWDRRDGHRDFRHDNRRDHRWSSRDHWRRDVHNGYYYRDAWFYGSPPARYYNDSHYRPGYRSWARGYRCPDYYRDNVVWDYGDYRLRRPLRGHHWVRADNDFLMVAIASGIIAEVILNDY